MDQPSDEASARRETLEAWVAEQAAEHRRPPDERERGLRGRVHDAYTKRRVRFAYRFQRFADRLLDRGFGTSEDSDEPEHEHADRYRYVASDWHVLPRALRYLGVSDQDTFVDFGCGKGRVVHQAAKRPFRRVIGVEISPVLAEIARVGLAERADQHRCPRVEIVVSDAADFRVPDDFTIGYLFHPFKDATLDAVLRRIVESIDRRPRLVRLIYVWPVRGSQDQILATGRFRLLKKQRSGLLDTWLSEAVIYESC